MRHKPKAKVKRVSASHEAAPARATKAPARAAAKGGAARAKSGAPAVTKAEAVKARLKGAKTVVAAVKSKTVAKASAPKPASVKASASVKVPASDKGASKTAAKPTVSATRPLRAAGKTLAIKTRKPKTPLSAAKQAKFALGQVVKHRIYAFRGVVFDIDPVFSNTEDWWLAIPADVRPRKDQPFYHLLAENEETEYIAYVSEQNLIADTSGQPLRHPQLAELFVEDDDGRLRAVFMQPN